MIFCRLSGTDILAAVSYIGVPFPCAVGRGSVSNPATRRNAGSLCYAPRALWRRWPRGREETSPGRTNRSSRPFRGGVKVLITGPHGLERKVTFALDEDPVLIAERVRETLEE